MATDSEIPPEWLEVLSLEALDAAEETADARESLIAFTEATFPQFKCGWFHRELAGHLEWFLAESMAGNSPRLIINAPPRHGKSELVSRRFPAWALGKYPDLDLICAGHTLDLMEEMSRDVQAIMAEDAYGAIFSTQIAQRFTRNPKNEKATDKFFQVVNGTGSLRAAGVGKAISGFGCRIFIVDDFYGDREQAESIAYNRRGRKWFTSTASTRIDEGGGMLIMATRWTPEDLSKFAQEQWEKAGRQTRVANYPAIAVEDEKHRRKGEALHPERHSAAELGQKRLEVGDHDWHSLFQGDPRHRVGGDTETDRIRIVDELPADPETIAVGVDKAATPGGGAFSVFVTIAKLKPNPVAKYALLDVYRQQVGADVREAQLVRHMERAGRTATCVQEQEPGSGGKESAQATERNLNGWTVRTQPAAGQGSKENRYEPFKISVNRGEYCAVRAAWNDPLFDELGEWPGSTYLDQGDACALGHNHLARARESWADVIKMMG